jgi:hypothetical protein
LRVCIQSGKSSLKKEISLLTLIARNTKQFGLTKMNIIAELTTWPEAFLAVGMPLGILLGFAAIIWVANKR